MQLTFTFLPSKEVSGKLMPQRRFYSLLQRDCWNVPEDEKCKKLEWGIFLIRPWLFDLRWMR